MSLGMQRTTEAESGWLNSGRSCGLPMAGDWPMTTEPKCPPSRKGDWHGGAHVQVLNPPTRASNQPGRWSPGNQRHSENTGQPGLRGPRACSGGQAHAPISFFAQAPTFPGSAAASHGNRSQASREILQTPHTECRSGNDQKAKSQGLGQK